MLASAASAAFSDNIVQPKFEFLLIVLYGKAVFALSMWVDILCSKRTAIVFMNLDSQHPNYDDGTYSMPQNCRSLEQVNFCCE